MGVTISRAEGRKSRPAPGRALAGFAASRNREAALLALAGGVVLFAMVLTGLAASHSFAETAARIARGEVVALSPTSRSTDLLPLLAFLPAPQERTFIADRIGKRLSEGPLDNVGELARLHVAANEVNAQRLPSLAARLKESGRDSVSLLAPAELRQIKPRLVVRTAAQFSQSYRWSAVLLLLGFLAAHLFLRWRRFAGDELLLPILLLLCGLGFVIMVSLRDPLRDLPLYLRFAYGVVAGCGLFVAGASIDLERTPLPRRGAWALGLAALLSALLILFGAGPGGSDAKVNLLGFQPVELIKILIALFLASYFGDRWELLREVRERRVSGRLAPLAPLARFLAVPRLEYVVPPLVAIGLVLFFFFLQKDLGPALVLASLFLLLFSVARGRPGMAVFGLLAVALACYAAYRMGYPRTVGQRIGMWLSPWDTWFHGGDHLAQATWSLATGGTAGTGLGLGEPGLVPEAHTDLVFAALGEELGFLGLLAVTGLYALLTQRGLRAAKGAGTPYGFFLGLGLTLLVALETVLIAGGVLRLLPLSGVASPFLSFGRSAMLANFLIVGFLASLSARRQKVELLAPFRAGARWVAVALAAFALLAVGRLAEMQLVRADSYLTRGAIALQGDGVRRFQYNPRLQAIAATIPRGSIVDRNGILLATSDAAALADQAAELTRLGAGETTGAQADGKVRVYPFGGRTFHLLGDVRNRVNWGAPNTSFVERDLRVRLQGYDDYAGVVRVKQVDGSETLQVAVNYRDLVPLLRHRYEPDSPEVQHVLGRDRTVRLTIDVRLQLAAAEVLKKYAAQAGSGAAAVVLDSATGDLLASVAWPFPARLPVEPERLASRRGSAAGSSPPPSPLLDRARYGVYPPGSTFKVVTALAALRKNPALAGRTFECVLLPDGRVGNRLRGRWVHDDPTDQPHGTINLSQAITHSCNAYFAQLGSADVGAQALLDTARIFGIDVARPNTVKQLEDSLAQSAYGQGQVVATPFEMARVAATVATGGQMPEGRWILGEENPRTGAPVTVLDAPTTGIVARAMRDVVTVGTAKVFLGDVQPPIAGKTGTAEVQDKKSHSWFIGFAPYAAGAAPAGTRRVAFSVIVEHGGYGGRLAAPAAGEIVRQAAALGLLVNHDKEKGTTP